MEKKSILMIIPYDELYPPTNGGMLRCFHLLVQLAKYVNLTIIIHQDRSAFLNGSSEYPELKEIDIISTYGEEPADLFSLFPKKIQNALRFRWYKKQVKGPAENHFIKYYGSLKKVLKIKKFDFVILEKLSTINAISIIRRYDKKVKIIYDAHNVDSELALQQNNEHYTSIKESESNLYKNIDAIIACSKMDFDKINSLNKGRLIGAVIPNGVRMALKSKISTLKSKHGSAIIFCGSLDYMPNAEGLRWFYDNVWENVRKEFPNLILYVVGRGEAPGILTILKNDSHIYFTGKVFNVSEFYQKSSLAIVPLFKGSGTRLKVTEAMSYGLPVVSTVKGAEGIDYQIGVNILIADNPMQFADSIIDTLKNEVKANALGVSGLKLVEEKYNWDNIGIELFDFLYS